MACLAAMLFVHAGLVAQPLQRDSLAFAFGEAVRGETLRKSSHPNPSNSVFGYLKGLYTMQSTDEYNGIDVSASFNLRGIATFGTATPLVLIDGVQRDLDNLSMVEIDRIEVLKDAVASALYGVQGANGAILITTRRGKAGFRVSADYSCTFDTPYRMPEFADAATYALALNEALALDGITTPRYSDREIGWFRDGYNRELYPDVDWQRMAYRNYGMSHNANVTFDGGSDRFRYFTSLSYSNTSGMLGQNDLFPQYDAQLGLIYLNLRTNIDLQLTNTTFLKVNLQGRLKETNRPGSSISSIVGSLYDIPAAAFPVKTGSGMWGGNNIYNTNPIADISDTGTVQAIQRSLLADMTLRQGLDFITPGLYAEATVAFDNMAFYRDQRTRTYQYESLTPIFDDNGMISSTNRVTMGTKTELGWSSALNNQRMFVMVKGTVGFDRQWGDHRVGAAVVYEQNSLIPNGRNSTRKRQSILGVVDYDYKGRYTVDAVVNYSGTAVLPEGDRFNVYPAVGVGWVASNESFLRDNRVVTYLKAHASAGLSGSDLFSHDLDLQTFGVTGSSYWFGSNNAEITGLKEGALPVVGLVAERSRKFDAGIDLGLWNRLYLSAGYFNEYRSNILVSGATVVSGVIGIDVPQLCEGKVRNHGVELSLQLSDRIGDFGYSLGGTFTYAKNRIINNNEGLKAEDYLYKKGHSLNQYYGLQSDGFYASFEEIENSPVQQSFGTLRPGDIRYVDQNNDGVINENDIVRLGYSTLPEIYYGFNVGLDYKGFSLYAHFQGVAHRNIYLNTSSVYFPLKNNTNVSTWYLNEHTRWTPETAATADLPRLTTEDNPNNFQKNDIWMANGSFLKLRNLELSYTLDKRTLRWADMRIFVRGTNLFSWDDLKYSDPENFGVAYPSMRSYTVGLELKF